MSSAYHDARSASGRLQVLTCLTVRRRCTLGASLLVLAAVRPLSAQTATIRGNVTRASDGQPLENATVAVMGTSLAATTRADGHFLIRGVPFGPQTLRVLSIGYAPRRHELTANRAAIDSVAIVLDPVLTTLADLTVTVVSRVPERLVSAPGAVASLDVATARDLAITGQPALALATLPGVDVIQTDVQDFNINARGFSAVFNRRVLVLQDGRDLAIPFLGAQEWLGMTATLEDMSKIEFVRGPSAALYGANAFAGVLNMTTPTARETPGSRLSVAGGELGTLRADFRNAGVLGGGRWGYRVTAGYSRSDAWARSRTDIGDLTREYSVAIDTTGNSVVHPFPGYELRALNGQTKAGAFGAPGAVTGTPDPVAGTYGSARLDYYAPNGSIVTAEGGYARTQNETLLGSATRFQITESTRPWFRMAWAADRYHVMAWYGGRDGAHQYNLAASTESLDRSHTLHVEAQYNNTFAADRGRFIVGGSLRRMSVNTGGTLIAPEFDNRADRFSALFGQVEYNVGPRVRLVVAARYDGSNLFASQWSPKAALVYSPSPTQSWRLTVGRAFQMPNTLDYFVSVPAGAPADFSALESGLRASAVGPALAAVPNGQLFTTSSAVPVLALGNPQLDVEHVTSYEVGYKGQFGRLFVTLDGYYSIMNGFVTDVLPGINPAFASWTAPAAVTDSLRSAVATAVHDALINAGQAFAAAALTRLANGNTALVLSVGNAGRATVRGIEADATLQLSHQLSLNANVSMFAFDLAASTFVAGDLVLPNTPARRGNLSVAYRGPHGLDLTGSLHFSTAFDWSAGTFAGRVPAAQTVNASASYPVTRTFRVQAVATDLFNQRRYQNFGGAVIGRRLLAGITAKF